MSTSVAGSTLDIHGGGKDLIFPHHENEIAQAEGADQKPFVRYWMHNGFVNINKEKMSKSLGNFMTVRDILKAYHPEVVRLFLLSKHYRSPLDFSPQVMEEIQNSLNKIYHTLDRIDQVCNNTKSRKPLQNGQQEQELSAKAGSLTDRFEEAMDDDFNTARAIGYIFDLIKSVNRILVASETQVSEPAAASLVQARSALKETGTILGILELEPSDYFAFKAEKVLESSKMDVEEIEKLVAERSQARREKNWTRADEIRDQLQQVNIILEDKPDGTTWRVV